VSSRRAREQTSLLSYDASIVRTTPEFGRVVSRVSADLTRDQQSNAACFVARISVAEKDQQRPEVIRLVRGIPAEVRIRTTERTTLSYLIKPLQGQVAFRRLDDAPIHARRRQASEKRQGTKSREVERRQCSGGYGDLAAVGMVGIVDCLVA
jgi:hypothetical protein